jgi:hypothetical protein
MNLMVKNILAQILQSKKCVERTCALRIVILHIIPVPAGIFFTIFIAAILAYYVPLIREHFYLTTHSIQK